MGWAERRVKKEMSGVKAGIFQESSKVEEPGPSCAGEARELGEDQEHLGVKGTETSGGSIQSCQTPQ